MTPEQAAQMIDLLTKIQSSLLWIAETLRLLLRAGEWGLFFLVVLTAFLVVKK